MSDAYGVLIFSKSDDCVFNQDVLLYKLNNYKWSECFTKWVSGRPTDVILADSLCSQFPTTYPERIASIFIENEDGEEVEMRFGEFEESHLTGKNVIDINYESPGIDEICEDISQALESGWIQIGLSGNMDRRYAYYQSLHIFSNGQGVRQYYMTGYSSTEGIRVEYTKNYLPS